MPFSAKMETYMDRVTEEIFGKVRAHVGPPEGPRALTCDCCNHAFSSEERLRAEPRVVRTEHGPTPGWQAQCPNCSAIFKRLQGEDGA